MSDSVWPTVVGGAISLVSTVVTTFGIEHLRQTRQARGTAYAFRASILSILTIVDIRQYAVHVREMIKHMEAGNAGTILKSRVKQNYLETYARHVDKVGLLEGPLPELISIFYTNVNSLVEDMQDAYDGGRDELTQTEMLRIYKEFEALLTETSKLGRHIVEVITKSYPPPKSIAWRIPG
ncbi:hypothetical protein [Paraburkholderia tropica]|uniref:hypothetical protein n=1 Tax=Paraburkholderia tropica TaxID=92647 RepID=UPI003D2A9667